jgi:hypothetical protein
MLITDHQPIDKSLGASTEPHWSVDRDLTNLRKDWNKWLTENSAQVKKNPSAG